MLFEISLLKHESMKERCSFTKTHVKRSIGSVQLDLHRLPRHRIYQEK